ncbi:MAG: DUF6973 domain-containing protein [Bdellovibrionales bacterium]
MISFFLTLSISVLNAADPHEVCLDWFLKSKLKKDRNCVLNCSILDTDMSTYMCPNQCEGLCKIDIEKSEVPTNLYGLTEDEVKICKEDPVLCVKTYKQSFEAENLCLEIYAKSETNDESDACRHFMWAAIMTRSQGSEKAKRVLDAHENNPKEPLDQKSMDLANNRAGIFTSEKLIKDERYGSTELKNEFLKQLRSGSLIILRASSEFSSIFALRA